jgi:glycosyltransferase involved in cell wall biosynthesis
MALIPESYRLPLVIVGQGKRYKQEVEARALALGMMDWLIWKTGVKTADLPWYYYKAQALVYPSWREGFGIPVIESLYCQTPVITTEVSSLPEAAGPGGILVAPKSPEALAAAMQRMLDTTVREKLAEDGLGYVEEQFDPSDICEQWMFLYKNVSGRS